MKNLAILIADSSAPEFKEIKAKFHPQVWNLDSKLNVQIFYVNAKPAKPHQIFLNYFTNSLRYSKVWPIQNVFDRIQLSPFNRKMVSVKLLESNLEVDVPEGLRYLGAEMQAVYKYIFNNGFDLIFRTTLSTVVNPKEFIRIVEGIPLDVPFYGGNVINFGKHSFVSGSNTYLNSRSGSLISDASKNWNHGFLDDVALGRILENKVVPTQINSVNVSSIAEVDNLTDKKIEETATFRCRTYSFPRTDIKVMEQVIKRIRTASL